MWPIGNSSRILFDDFELADWILSKLSPHIPDLKTADGRRHRVYSQKTTRGAPKETSTPPVQLSRLNERLRYLKYGPGQFFARHCDGTYYTPDRTEVSYYTLQLYLNGDADTLKGGATRFHPAMKKKPGQKDHIDVEPRMGRALIFDQAGLLHSGEEVESGIKLTIRTEFMYKRPDAAE